MDRFCFPWAWPRGRRAPAGRRAGFTLVELLVVITIIGILMSMLLPAVNQVRESGRQVQCKNNLRQLAMAMDLYHAKQGSLPYGAWYTATGSGPDWKMTSFAWTAMHLILPYVEQDAIYRGFKFTPYTGNDWSSKVPSIPGSSPAQSVKTFRISVFVCPSDSARGVVPGSTTALCNYAPSSGSVSLGDGNWNCKCPQSYSTFVPKNPSPRRAGAFRVHNNESATYQRPATNYAMIRDGQANTILIGEMRYGCSSYIGSGWTSPLNGSALISTIMPINIYSCDPSSACQTNPCKSAGNGNLSRGFKSTHPGGANFAMCDGSVHFFDESIDHQMYQYLGACDDEKPTRIP